MLQHRFALHERFRKVPIASKECASAGVLSMLQTATVYKLTWPGEYTPFIMMCTDMVREWTPPVRPLSEDVPVFGDTF